MPIKFKIIESSSINEYQTEFINIEKNITYPLDEGIDSFTINHGEKYNKFFSDMGKSRFILALDSEKLCGSIAGVWKKIKINEKNVCGLYVGDLKTIPKYRGLKIPLKMIFHAFLKYILNRKYRGWSFLYYIGMNGESGNITKTFKGLHLGKLSKSTSNQRIYIISSNSLSKFKFCSTFFAKHNLDKVFIANSTISNWDKVITHWMHSQIHYR